MKALAALTLAAVAAATSAHAERLTVAVSMPQVQITSNFTGSPLAVFGVVQQDGAATPTGNYQVAVVVLGPIETVVERRKDRIAGIWANGAARTIANAPSFYSLSTTGPLDAVAQPPVLQRLQIGFANLDLARPAQPMRKAPRSATPTST
ncbi:MAG: TIGR02186 family protein [Bauldia sp.]